MEKMLGAKIEGITENTHIVIVAKLNNNYKLIKFIILRLTNLKKNCS